MIKPNTAHLPQYIPKHAELTELELKELLCCFATDRQKRIIKGIALNPGVLTHDAERMFYCTYISSFIQSVAVRLAAKGYKVICIRPTGGKYYKSHHWYFCHIGEIEIFEVDKAANDEVFL